MKKQNFNLWMLINNMNLIEFKRPFYTALRTEFPNRDIRGSGLAKRGWTAPFLHRRDAQSGLALQLCEVPWDVGRGTWHGVPEAVL